MEQRSEKLREIPLEDVRAHPEVITDLLRGDDDDVRLLEEARADHRRRKSQGYTREDAFADLEGVYAELDRRSEDD